VSQLVSQVYDAALDSDAWSDVGTGLCRALDAPSMGMHVRTAAQPPQWLARTPNISSALDEFNAHYHRFDVWAQRAAGMELSRIFTSDELISHADLMRSEFYDWLRKVDVAQTIGCVFEVSSGTLGVLGVHRPKSAAAYSVRDGAFVGQLLPHVKRALQVRQRLATAEIERQAGLDALARTGAATLVVDRDGTVLYANGDAEELLRDGDVVGTGSGRLLAQSPARAHRLAQLIMEAVDAAAGRGGSGGGVLELPRGDRLPLTVLVAPFRPARDGFGAPAPAAILFVRDPEAMPPTGAVLRGLFGLTPAQAGLAVDLCRGLPLEEIARTRRISMNTARTHLKELMAKCGAKRQGELVALLLCRAGGLGG
jgi:DNA-binding CsgD family transcriptional regulator